MEYNGQLLSSYAEGSWVEGTGAGREASHAVTGKTVATVNSDGLDFAAMLQYGRNIGGPALRKMTFHERALMLKAMAKHLLEHKNRFYNVSAATGATKVDSWIDIEGGIGTFFVFSGKGRRELPDQTFHIEGDTEQLSKEGSFVGQHICVPLEGVALHINAFNFPCWGMLEKLAPTFLAGMPAIVKPASQTAYLTHCMVQCMLESGILPEGALQIICGGVGDTFDHLTCQDVVTFTGSAATGKKLKQHPSIIEHSIRFNLEADSLNCSILGADVTPDTEEFGLFVKEVAKEMTVKAGQKCTAIRRTIVPEGLVDDVVKALSKRLDKTVLGNPSNESVRMGPLVSRGQVEEVGERVQEIAQCAELVYGGLQSDFNVVDADRELGAFFPPTLLYCKSPLENSAPHDIEPFGPVSTVLPYSSIEEALSLIHI